MATRTHDKKIVEFEIVPDEVGGWDVIKAGGEQALSNHSTRESAEEAARLRGREEEADDVRVLVRDDVVHHVEDETRGVKTAFLALLGLLLVITLLGRTLNVVLLAGQPPERSTPLTALQEFVQGALQELVEIRIVGDLDNPSIQTRPLRGIDEALRIMTESRKDFPRWTR